MTAHASWLAVLSAALLSIGIAVARGSWVSEKIQAAQGVENREAAPEEAVLQRDGRPVVLILGDSRMAQWPIDGHAMPWQFHNRGRAGETAQQLVHRFAAELQHVRPQAAVLSTGINDVVGISFMPRAEGELAVGSLLVAFRLMAEQAAETHVRFFLTTIIPPSRPSLFRRLFWSSRTMAVLQDLNSRLRAQRWPPDTILIDLARLYPQDEGGFLDQRYRKDALHLNSTAYQILQDAIVSTLALQSDNPTSVR